MKKLTTLLGLVIGLPLVVSTGCDSDEAASPRPVAHWTGITKAVAVMHPTAGGEASGQVWFTQEDDGVRIVADIGGLTPNARHAIHIHQFGDASAADGTSAGGHYNPAGNKHGAPDAAERHAGDLGNLHADGAGNAHYDRTDSNISLAGLKNPILGLAVIIHAGEDKFTQPTGGAGARIGIGVIGTAKP